MESNRVPIDPQFFALPTKAFDPRYVLKMVHDVCGVICQDALEERLLARDCVGVVARCLRKSFASCPPLPV
jgi:hypothetical protein